MELEHMIMRRVMRIASQARRKHEKLPQLSREEQPKCRGFGHILDLLTEQNGLSPQQIAASLDIRPQSASEAISNMEQSGLVYRQTNEQDKRSSLIYITTEGQMRQKELLDERIEKAKRVFSPLTEEEKETLLSLLNKVTDALQKEEN